MTATRARLSHRLETLAYRAFGALLGRLPMDSCVTLGRWLGGAFHCFSPRYRRLVRRNLRIATAGRPPSPAGLDRLVRETFRHSGGNFLASFKTASMPAEQLLEHFDPAPLVALAGDVVSGRGNVIAMAHMGNWEALARLAALVLPAGSCGGIYRPLNNPLMDDLTRRQRTSAGARLFSRTDGFHAPAAFLKQGGVLGVLADHRAGARGVTMPFLGKLTTCSPLPELLARRSKARVSTLHTLATAPGTWSLVLQPLPDGADARLILSGIETMIRDQLTDVFWFHDRWKTDSTNPLSLYTRLDPAVAATAEVPLRLLLSTPPAADESSIQGMLDAMFELRPDLRIERLATPHSQSHDPRVILHSWDPAAPPEHAGAILARIDSTHPAPLDGALLLGSERPLALAARREGLRCLIGIEVSGKPWSRSLDLPTSPAGWREIATNLAWVPDRHR